MKFYVSKNEFIESKHPIDISIPFGAEGRGVRAWYVEPPLITPVQSADYIGSVYQGGSTNFRDISFNPHGHGTHTECVGHITNTVYSINDRLKEFHFLAELVSVSPIKRGDDWVITKNCLSTFLFEKVEALVIRTLPNHADKVNCNYSNSNPPYFDVECNELFKKWGVQHLLVDLPSVDRESDGGQLLMHNAFWDTSVDETSTRTITELIFVPSVVEDGSYLLNLQVASIVNDAAPSRPVLFKIVKEN